MDHLGEPGVCLTRLPQYSRAVIAMVMNERASLGLIVLISGAHAAERVTDYPAARRGQRQSLPVEIIQFANGFNAAALCSRLALVCAKHTKSGRRVEEEEKCFCIK